MVNYGYNSEYSIKKKLNADPYTTAVKTTNVKGVPDIIAIYSGLVDYGSPRKHFHVKGIEVKSTNKSVYRPSKRDRRQYRDIKAWSEGSGIPVEYWLVFKTRSRGKNTIVKLTLKQFGEKYIKEAD